MTRPEKKERERQYLDLFRTLVPDVPTSDPVSADPPDFIFDHTEGSLGVEITEYFQPKREKRRPFQEQDSLRQKVIDAAAAQFAATDSRIIRVKVLFRPRSEIDKTDIPRLARQLAEVVAGTETQPGQTLQFDYHHADLPSPITTLFISELPEPYEPHWQHAFASWVQPLTPEDILRQIRRKERGFASYPPTVQVAWLVIVLGYKSRASSAELTEKAFSHTYPTRFARVFFLDSFNRSVTPLVTASPSLG